MDQTKEKAKCANCGGWRTTVYRGSSSYQNAVFEATKKKQDINYSLFANRQPKMLHPNPTFSAINISVLVVEVLSKFPSTFTTMSYSDIINVVSISASRVFSDKIEGQKIYDSIKNTQ